MATPWRILNLLKHSLRKAQQTKAFGTLYINMTSPIETSLQSSVNCKTFNEPDPKWLTHSRTHPVEAKLHYTSCLDGVWIKMKKVWINPNNSHDSLDRSKLRPSQTPTNHPWKFCWYINSSVPRIKLYTMKSKSCWRLYYIQSKNPIVEMWSVQICIAWMGVCEGM